MNSRNTPRRPLLIVITGPTASGKTDLAIGLAERLGCEIISADSRQLYHQIPIGTAAPSPEQLGRVRHHLTGILNLDEYYSAARFEADSLSLLPAIFERSGGTAVVCGGSMMYIDALTKGIDEMPTVRPEVRSKMLALHEQQGDEALLALLEITDPDYYAIVDKANIRRVIHALEISMEAGVPYSRLRTGRRAERDFDIVTFAIDMPREQLFNRINRRVESMIEKGLIDEARSVEHLRHLNSLNTVGFKEMFAYFDGVFDLPTAIARIQKNTRVYAKKQMTWLKRDASAISIPPDISPDELIKLSTRR